MTALDTEARAPGLYDSAWPAECGGARRQKLVRTPGLGLRPGEHLSSTTRHIDGWPVMFVQRGAGELYLQCGAGLDADSGAPQHRPGGSDGWIEQVDPVSLETISRSPDLPSGGWLWCGATVVHANGDLYVVNGRYLHRLRPDCSVVDELVLPVDGPYNGVLVLPDGNLLTRNLGFREGEEASFLVVDPDLEPVGEPFVVPGRCMGRFSADRTSAGVDHVYFTTATEVRRLVYQGGSLMLDETWRGTYAVAGDQSDAWDTTIGDDNVWLMDAGRPPGWGMPAGVAPQRAFRFSVADASDSDVVDVIGEPGAWNPGPPLYDPVRHVLVHYDSVAGVVAAHRFGENGLVPLWQRRLRSFVQMLCWADTGELVVEDAGSPDRDMSRPSSDAVVLDIETGAELGRAPTGSPATFGMFCCPGFERDFYVAGLPGGIARIAVTGDPHR